MANYITQFPLKTQKFQEDILDKRFEIGRQIYNSLVNVTQKRYKEMIKTKRYRGLMESLTDDKKQNKVVWRQIGEIRKECGFSKYDFYKDIKKMQHHFKDNIDSNTVRCIADSLWRAYHDFFFGGGETINYKKFGEFNMFEGKSNGAGIMIRKDNLVWSGLTIPIMIDHSNQYECQAMQSEIRYSRVIRKFIRGKYKYYIQIVFRGIPPVKLDRDGNPKHLVGNGDVGLDIGVSTVAIASKSDVKIYELANKVQNIENRKRVLLRAMDRSLRATNLDNFNEDGTIKKQGCKKVKWVKSNRYVKHQSELKELYRKQADVRKYQHNCLANEIITLGDRIYVETMNFAGLQKRANKTEKNDRGKFKSKKRFGKTIGNRAPSMLLGLIDGKLRWFDKELIEINTCKAKASQFNHFDETCTKKPLSKRWNDFDGIKIQRDMYSAFLIMNINDDLETFNIDKCNERFENFMKLHDKEVQRLKGNKNLSCIAI